MAYWVAVLTSCTSFFSKKSLTFLQSRSRNSSPWGWLGSTDWLTSMYLGKNQIKKYIQPRYVDIQALVKFKRKFSKRVVTEVGWLFLDSWQNLTPPFLWWRRGKIMPTVWQKPTNFRHWHNFYRLYFVNISHNFFVATIRIWSVQWSIWAHNHKLPSWKGCSIYPIYRM